MMVGDVQKGARPKQRERYSLKFQHEAVRMSEETGNQKDVARCVAIPLQTLNNWVVANKAGKLTANVKLDYWEICCLIDLIRSAPPASGRKDEVARLKIRSKLEELIR